VLLFPFKSRPVAADKRFLAPVLVAILVLAGQSVTGQSVTDQTVPAGGTDGDAPSFTPLPPPSLNFYGSPGLIDMPSGQTLPDGQFTTAIAYFGGQMRYTMSFQATPWMSTSFRYNSIQNWNLGGFSTYYDRGFDVRFRLLREALRWPEITLGLQDFAGTGIYASEYIVATKTLETPGLGAARLPGRLRLTGGLGWGRLGSSGSIGSPFGSSRPAFDPTGTGGQLAYDQWFRGPMAPFGGIEWSPDDRLSLKAEYSSDAYVTETQTTSVFDRKSRFNFGAEYQVSPRTRLGAYYLYGSELGLSVQIQLNPANPPRLMQVPAPAPIRPRPARAASPEQWSTQWATGQSAPLALRDVLEPVLRQNGLILETLNVTATTAELRFRNLEYRSFANAVGRAARALAQVMPASVETFVLVPLSGGMALSATTIRRSDLEALEFDDNATGALLAVTGFGDAAPLAETAVPAAGLYPETSWSVIPYASPSYFDPDRPFRIDVGLEAGAIYRPAPGWTIAGTVRQRVAGNVADSNRPSNSVLPHVRTDGVLYAQADTTLNTLYAARQWRPGRDLYARMTFGYLEPMFGGLSTELLWKPVNSRLGISAEANYVRQRDYDQKLGFRDYSVFTGYVRTYYDFGGGWNGQLDVGRYLAGDVGATVTLDREFNNGWLVGGFFTLTNVSAEDFGEGSFDKGIRLRIPVGWFLGKPSRQAIGTTIRPIQRDGGQQLRVPGQLYQQVRDAHRRALSDQWARVWE
jgi:Exopolysaccharide biosynthesis protein YbjH